MEYRIHRSGRSRSALLSALLALCAIGLLPMAARAQSQPPDGCKGHDGIAFLCGPQNIEDMVQIPARHILVAASFASTTSNLSLIDTDKRSVTPLDIALPPQPESLYADCPSPLDLSQFSPHGIALRAGANGRHTLYAVNHGGRESVEVFALDVRASEIHARWLGCVVLPDGASGNAVAPLSDGGFVVSKFYDTHRPQRPQFLARERTSVVYRWSSHGGLSVVSGSEGVGDNGLAVSRDGAWLYVAVWIEHRITRLPLRGNRQPTSVSVDFMPDNLTWAPDGSLLVAGQATDIELLAACKHPRCAQDWAIARLDPQTMTLSYLYWEKGTPEFAGATTALQVGNKLWIGTFRGDRIAIADVPSEPLHP